MANEIIKYLLETQPDMKDYLSSNPYYASGVSLAQTPLPVAQSNWEAALLPLAKGALAGGLTSYGKQDAYNTAYRDYADNNILKALANAESGTNYQQEMPAGWSPQKGKTDLLFALLAKENEATVQAANAKAELENKLEIKKALASQGINAGIGADGQVTYAGSPEYAAAKGAITAAEEAAKQKASLIPDKAKKDAEDVAYKRIVDTPSYKQYSDISANFKTLLAVKDSDSAAAAPAVITSFARILDPASTVREGEYKTVSSSVQGYLDKISGNWRLAMEGKTNLSQKARDQIAEIAAQKYNEFGRKYESDKSLILEDAKYRAGTSGISVPVPSHSPYKKTPTIKEKDAAREEMKRIDEALKKRGA